MTNNKYKILLVEDDGSIRSIMTTMLESAGYQVIPADTCGLAKTLFASHLPDVTILDLGLPDMDGMRMLEFVRKDSLALTALMFIGASPGSTGGGIKTSTFLALIQGMKAAATNQSEKAFHNAIPRDAFRKAAVITLLAMSVVVLGTWAMALLIQIVLIALNAVFASAELAVLSVNEGKIDRLAEQGNRKAKRLRNLTKEPAKFLSTIQIAITLSGFLGSAFAADGFSDPLVDWLIGLGVPLSRSVLDTLSVIFITLILSYFTLIFGELVPKRIAMKKSEALALGVSGVVSGISVLFKPIVWLLSISTNAVLRLLGIDPNEEDERICEEDIRMMVETGGETGAIDKEEQDFIQNVFEFDDLSAGEILTHRTDLVILWMEDTDDMWEEVICGSGFSRYPVCDGSPDQVIGILNAKVYLRQKDRSRENILKLAVEPAYFVPETIKADVLFRNMKQSHNAFAVVLDEYGGMTGIVTLSDLIEELVGEIRENPADSKNEEPSIRQIDDNTWEITGNIELEAIEKAVGVDFEMQNVNTITGLVFDHLKGIPNDGATNLCLQLGSLSVQIKEIREHQVVHAEIVRNAPAVEKEVC